MSKIASEWEGAPELPADHHVSSDLYVEQEVFDIEIDRIFRRQWKFACHESELLDTGDFHTAESDETRLIASGRYTDRIVIDTVDIARLAGRHVTLGTVTWSPGLHVPV